VIDIAIPGYGSLRLTELVCDFNGTLATAGGLAPGVRERLPRLAGELRIHVVTGDTFGTARAELAGLPCAIVVLAPEGQAEAKARFARELGTPNVIAIGNGRNDRLLLEAAALAIGVCGREGIASEALHASDIVVPDPVAALDLLLDTTRLVATLRS
jgi:soluble P-type ATPase